MVWTAGHFQGLCSWIRCMTAGRITPSKETGKACTRYASRYSQKYSNSGLAGKHIWVLLQGGVRYKAEARLYGVPIRLYAETTQLEK